MPGATSTGLRSPFMAVTSEGIADALGQANAQGSKMRHGLEAETWEAISGSSQLYIIPVIGHYLFNWPVFASAACYRWLSRVTLHRSVTLSVVVYRKMLRAFS